MNKSNKILFTILSISTCVVLCSATIIEKSSPLFKAQEIKNDYVLNMDVNTIGVPEWTEEERIFSIKSTNGNAITFRSKGFGKYKGQLCLDDRYGYLYNITPINKITAININQTGLLISHISYGNYTVYDSWQPDYQIIGNITYGVEDETIQGYTRTWYAPKNREVNVFKIHKVSGATALYLDSLAIKYTCA